MLRFRIIGLFVCGLEDPKHGPSEKERRRKRIYSDVKYQLYLTTLQSQPGDMLGHDGRKLTDARVNSLQSGRSRVLEFRKKGEGSCKSRRGLIHVGGKMGARGRTKIPLAVFVAINGAIGQDAITVRYNTMSLPSHTCRCDDPA